MLEFQDECLWRWGIDILLHSPRLGVDAVDTIAGVVCSVLQTLGLVKNADKRTAELPEEPQNTHVHTRVPWARVYDQKKPNKSLDWKLNIWYASLSLQRVKRVSRQGE